MAERHPKLTQGLVRTLRSTSSSDQQIPILVRYTAEHRVLRHSAPMRGVRHSYRYHLRPFMHMFATPPAIARLAEDPEVVRIYEDLPVHAYLDTSVPHIEVPRLWQEGLDGRGVRIAIIDTGVDPEHPDLAGRVLARTDLTGQGADDGHGHGTHCAGIAAGSGAASNGRYRGVAPSAGILSAKVLRNNGDGMMSDVMAGIEWAVDQGAQIISLSLGGPGPCDGTDALCETCDAAVAEGVVLCVAAGNDGPRGLTVGSPGCARQVITIGACSNQDQVADFSSRGPTADGRIKPDVLLPGVGIVAARAHGTSMGTIVDAHYTSASGTSMATPHAAGVCALLLQAEPHLRPGEIKERLMATALDLGQDPNAQGCGRVDAWRARHAQPSPAPPQPAPEPAPQPNPAPGCLSALLAGVFSRRTTPHCNR